MADERLKRISRDIFLAAFGDLGDVEDDVVERVVALMDERALADGDTLFVEGTPPESVYMMRDGRVRMSQSNGVTWRVEGRWVHGSHDAILERAYTATATAEGPLHILQLRSSAWLELLEDCFDLTKRALEGTARAVAALEERVPVPPIGPRAATRATSTLVEKLSFMLDVRMLRGAGVQALADLATSTTERSFQGGDLILAARAERRELLFVVDGEVRARNATAGVARVYGVGDVVCGAASFGPAASRWEAMAAGDVRILLLPIDVWYDAMEEHFDLARAALTALTARRQLLIEALARQGELVLT
jgi:CRP-like cAMP-binding protein